MKYKYKITIEEISSAEDASTQRIEFEADGHEDWFVIAQKMKHHPGLEPDDAEPFAIGLKLFSGILMKQKSKPMFQNLLPAFKEFMMALKKG